MNILTLVAESFTIKAAKLTKLTIALLSLYSIYYIYHEQQVAIELKQERQRQYNRTINALFVLTDEREPLNIITDQTKGVVKVNEKVVLTEKEKQCLAKNIYHEAGIESELGKIAVAQVTLNRVKSHKWGDDVCSVVYEKNQFTWTANPKKRYEHPKGKNWEDSKRAMALFQDGIRVKRALTSDHYHANWIRPPNWARNGKTIFLGSVGKHMYYKERNQG